AAKDPEPGAAEKLGPPEPVHEPQPRGPPAESARLLSLWAWGAVAALGLFLMALIQSEGFRQRCRRLVVRLGRVLQFLFIDAPAKFVELEAVQRLAESWPFQLFYWYLFKPLAACVLVWPLIRGSFSDRAFGLLLIFVVSSFLLNSRLGQGTTDALTQAVVRLYELLRAGLLPGLYRLVMQVFKRIVDVVEGMLFGVDEWLRFR